MHPPPTPVGNKYYWSRCGWTEERHSGLGQDVVSNSTHKATSWPQQQQCAQRRAASQPSSERLDSWACQVQNGGSCSATHTHTSIYLAHIHTCICSTAFMCVHACMHTHTTHTSLQYNCICIVCVTTKLEFTHASFIYNYIEHFFVNFHLFLHVLHW